MSMRKTTLAPGQLLRSVHMEKSYLGKAGYPVLYNGNLPLEVAAGQRKTHVNSYRRQTMHQGKVDPGVSNELSRDHVNRPIEVEGNAQTDKKIALVNPKALTRVRCCLVGVVTLGIDWYICRVYTAHFIS